jgi:hypothetical protein
VATGGAGSISNGGAINADGSTLNLSNSSFASNQSKGGAFNGSFNDGGSQGLGGAILLDTSSTTVTLTNCTLTGNQAIGGSGATGTTAFADVGIGGAIMDIAGSLSLTNCALNGNQATGSSGAIIASSFTGVGVGGGIAMEGGTLTVANSTLFLSAGPMGHTGGCPANSIVSAPSSIGTDSVRYADTPNSHLERADLCESLGHSVLRPK